MTTTERTAGRGAGRDYGIWLLAASIATAAAVVLVISRHLPGPRHPLGIPWWALLLAFYAAECLVVHVHFRRRTQTLTLAEIPLLLGLYSLSPLGLLAAQLGGSGAALLLFKRQRPQKAAVTLAQTALGTSLALAVYRSVVRGHDPYGPTGWLAGFAAAETATFAGVVLLAAAVAFTERGAVAERITSAAGVSFLGTLIMSSLGLAAAALAQVRTSAVALLLLPAAAGALAVRAYAAQRHQADHVESLYDSIRRAGAGGELGPALMQLLLSARRLLRAEYGELLLLPIDAREQPLRSSVGPAGETTMEPTQLSGAELIAIDAIRERGGLVTLPKGRRIPELEPYAQDRGLDDAIAATLEGENGLLGLLVVGDRAGDGSFGQEDEKLFRTFAGHVALLLENEQLEQSLAKLTELEAKLRHQALHDALTGLPNRRLFLARVEQSLERAAADGSDPIVLFLDLDGFKAINDDLGHAAGDELLVAFGERLRGSVRPEELPARLGGDEFAVLIESGGPEVAEDVARRLVAAVRDPFSIHGRRLSIHLSIGIARASEAAGAEELLANADVAMYTAKGDGSSSYAVYTDGMHTSGQARRRLGEALEEALERDQIAVQYQPVVDLRSGETVAFEALARWRRDGSDTVAAADFLSAAEEGELMERIGEVVLRAACVQTQEWRGEPGSSRGLSVSVNLSAAELANPQLTAHVADALIESGLDARRLILEVTAGVAERDAGTTLAVASELRRLGIRFALDDFGNGHSSLELLCRLPFDVVKIARPVVARAGTGRDEERVARAVVGLARSLGLEVVAEGIESREQAELLRSFGCQLGQGFYFDRALGAAQATRRLRTPAVVPLRVLAADTA